MRFPHRHRQGSSLLISLVMIVLITVVILAFMSQATLERQLASTIYANSQARIVAQMGFDAALAKIRENLAPYDDPFGSTPRPTNFWSLSPGRMDIYEFQANSAGRPQHQRTVELHSGYDPSLPTNELVNLNAQDFSGQEMIWPGGPAMPVQWVAVRKNPNEPASTNNPIVGRYAYWVDDEGSKINVNTADGTDNYTLSSYGQGTPTAVSLSVFADTGVTNAPDQETVREIAASARKLAFGSVMEIPTRPGLTNEVNPKFWLSNAFNLTTYNRSSDFNIFNLPKIQLIPSNLTDYSQLATNLAVNRNVHYNILGYYYGDGGTRASSALRSVYPTPLQLPNSWTNVWPFLPTYKRPGFGNGNISHYNLLADAAKMSANGGNFPLLQGARFTAAVQMANYLIGKDPLGQTINWPFADPNYLGKYNLRQIDSITVQTIDLASATSQSAGSSVNAPENTVKLLAPPTIAPYGILGDQPVMSAMGRYPRLTRVAARMAFYERPPKLWRIAAGTATNAINYKDKNGDGIIDFNNDAYFSAAELEMDLIFSIYVPRYLYESDNFVGKVQLNSNLGGKANMVDLSTTTSHGIIDFLEYTDAPFGWGNQGLNETSGMVSPTSKWADALIYAEASEDGINFEPGNSSGIDFNSLAAKDADTDSRAKDMRREEYKSLSWVDANKVTNTVSGLQIWGTGPSTPDSFPMLMRKFGPLEHHYSDAVPGIFANYAPVGFPSGSARTKRLTRNRSAVDEEVETKKIRLRGGVTLRFNQGKYLVGMSPIDAIRGPLFSGNWTNATIPLVDASAKTAWRSSASNAVAQIFGKNGLELAPNNTRYLVSMVRDPLGGQLPGDWVNRVYSSLPPGNTSNIFRVFNANKWPSDLRWALESPNSGARDRGHYDYQYQEEWVDMAADTGHMNVEVGQPTEKSQTEILLPVIENGVQKLNIQRRDNVTTGGSVRVLNIAKQRNFPSVGQLQYMRTGVMPDRADAQIGDYDYAGMPFRLLNFGPKETQGTQGTQNGRLGIPDWAMLDLYVVPNAIWTKPSSRFGSSRELIHLTYGGASTGKLNLNGSVVWPWAGNDTNYVRPMPLAAQFTGLRYNTNGVVNRQEFTFNRNLGGQSPLVYSVNSGSAMHPMGVLTDTNSWSVLHATNAKTLAQDIAKYIRQNGPLAMPGQMCDIPEVSADYGAKIPTRKTIDGTNRSLLPPTASGTERSSDQDHFYTANVHSGGINRTRNDIVSQSIGNFTTQGNVFSVWVVAESIKKNPQNLTGDPGEFEPDKGDKITGETRMRLVVERMLDPGVDGVYGNSKPGGPGPDTAIGTLDDLMDTSYHPSNPRFIYKVIRMEEIQ